jgi:hypothetical protein
MTRVQAFAELHEKSMAALKTAIEERAEASEKN